MLKTSSKVLVYLLSLLQIALSFVLGVFGNKLAELIKISPQTVLLCIVTTIVLLLVVTVMLLNYQSGTVFSFPRSGILTTGRMVTSRIITTFPFAVVLGSIGQFVLIILMPFRVGSIDVPFVGTYINNYEVLSGLLAFASLFLLRGLRRDLVLMLTYCLGLATGISGTLLLVVNYDNALVPTFVWWEVVLFIMGILVGTKRIRRYFQVTYQNLTQER